MRDASQRKRRLPVGTMDEVSLTLHNYTLKLSQRVSSMRQNYNNLCVSIRYFRDERLFHRFNHLFDEGDFIGGEVVFCVELPVYISD